MTKLGHPPTASGAVTINRLYRAEDTVYEQLVWGGTVTDREVAGVSDPILVEPINFDAELAKRERTHRPISPPDTDLSNTVFGI